MVLLCVQAYKCVCPCMCVCVCVCVCVCLCMCVCLSFSTRGFSIFNDIADKILGMNNDLMLRAC